MLKGRLGGGAGAVSPVGLRAIEAHYNQHIERILASLRALEATEEQLNALIPDFTYDDTGAPYPFGLRLQVEELREGRKWRFKYAIADADEAAAQ